MVKFHQTNKYTLYICACKCLKFQGMSPFVATVHNPLVSNWSCYGSNGAVNEVEHLWHVLLQRKLQELTILNPRTSASA